MIGRLVASVLLTVFSSSSQSVIFPLGNGEVDFEEFLLMMKKQMMSRDADSEMLEAFKVFDRNGDGQIR